MGEDVHMCFSDWSCDILVPVEQTAVEQLWLPQTVNAEQAPASSCNFCGSSKTVVDYYH